MKQISEMNEVKERNKSTNEMNGWSQWRIEVNWKVEQNELRKQTNEIYE